MLDDEPAARSQDDGSQEKIGRGNWKGKTENDELIAPIKRPKSDHTIFGSPRKGGIRLLLEILSAVLNLRGNLD